MAAVAEKTKKKKVVLPSASTEKPVILKKKPPQKAAAAKTPKVGPSKRAKKSAISLDVRSLSNAALVSAMQAERVASGDALASLGGSALRQVIGIRVPFVFEWLIGANMLPLSKLIQVVGKTGTNKSALAFEMLSWITKQTGFGFLFDVENKFNALFANSFLGYPASDAEEVLGIVPCYSCTDWQEKLQRRTFAMRDAMLVGIKDKDAKKKSKPIGDVFPVGFVVDSVVAKLTEKAQKAVEDRGFGDKKYADEALSITYFLKSFVNHLAHVPFSLILINHLKVQKQDGSVIPEKKKGGGDLIGFQESIELEMSKVKTYEHLSDGADSDESLDVGGNCLKLNCTKNSYGPTGRKIDVDLIWTRKYEQGELRQYSRWNWSGAMVNILLSYKAAKAARRIRDVVDITADADRTCFWSDRLKITKANAVSQSELGRLISKDADIKHELRKLLGIREYALFQPGVSYQKQLKDLGAKIHQDVAKNLEE